MHLKNQYFSFWNHGQMHALSCCECNSRVDLWFWFWGAVCFRWLWHYSCWSFIRRF